MLWIRTKAKRPFRMRVTLVAITFCMAQVSPLFANYETTCKSKSQSGISPVFSSPSPECCCGQSGTCCCDVSQKSETSLPEMTFTANSICVYNPVLRGLDSDTGFQSPFQTQVSKSIERWLGKGPPLQSCYLVNLTFRC
jgi:hypothetical protein